MVNKETILELNEIAEEISVSIYMPTNKSEPEASQDSIRFKNLLKNLRNQLSEKGLNEKETEELLSKAESLLGQSEFWRYNDKGLAIFITDEFFKFYRLPFEMEERILIDNHFLVTPLIRMMTLEGTFCILSVSQKNVRLLKCTSESVEQIEITDAPTNLEEFRKFDVYQKSVQQHSGENRGGAIFHGHGGGDDSTKVVEEYLRTIENEVTSVMRKRQDPLILAGVDNAVAHYRKANHYHRLMDEAIIENPDLLSDEELKSKAWEHIQSYFLKDMYDDLERLGNASETDKYSGELQEIIEGAYFGKVDTLFIPVGKAEWGNYKADENSFNMVEAENGGYQRDLLNAAAIYTLKKGGNVYSLDKSEVPSSSGMAAIFRYA